MLRRTVGDLSNPQMMVENIVLPVKESSQKSRRGPTLCACCGRRTRIHLITDQVDMLHRPMGCQ